jgi:hypothetical protein
MQLGFCLWSSDDCPGLSKRSIPSFSSVFFVYYLMIMNQLPTEFFFFSPEKRTVAVTAISTCFFWFSFCGTSPSSLKPFLIGKLLLLLQTFYVGMT